VPARREAAAPTVAPCPLDLPHPSGWQTGRVTDAADPVDLRHQLGAVPVGRDVVQVTGPDALAYLQGQLSQDVEALAVGATAWSFVLQPTGKVDAWGRVTRTGDDVFVLDVDNGGGEGLVARLRRFLLRTKAEVERLDWSCVALRGPGAAEAAATAKGSVELRLPAGWPGVEGVDLLGPDVVVPEGVRPAGPEEYEALRILAGVPALGAELTDKTIPAEMGQWVIDGSVDFTKGCFTGQELVARIDSRGGNVPRRLRGVVLQDQEAAPPPVGSAVLVGDKEVGTVSSSARSPVLGPAVALAAIARAVEPPAEAIVSWGDVRGAATIHGLPLVGTD
jgi:folate-binding protein YgfZ